MRLRTQLVLAFLVITVFIALGVSISMEFDLDDLAADSIVAAESGIRGVTQANYDLSQKILTDYGQKIVEMKARSVAKELSLLLGGRESYDYDAMRRDDKLRRIATQNIYAWHRDAAKRAAGYVDLLDNKGVSVLHPMHSVEGRNFREWKEQYPEMWRLVKLSFKQKEVKGYYCFFDKATGKKVRKYMVLEQVADTPFILVAAVTIDHYFQPVHKMIRAAGRSNLDRAEQEIKKNIGSARSSFSAVGMAVGAIVVLIAILLGLWFAGSISRPVLRLRDGVARIGQGDFSVAVEEKGSREIVQLGHAFNLLGERLNEYMENLKREVEARQAVESEIKIAGEIQQSLLPRTFPPFPDRHEFDLYAAVAPAREVAGDFYDFFFSGRDTLVCLVADVSGKGLPAALVMTATRTLLRNVCSRLTEPGPALAEANDVLCQDNEKCMFVTLFLAYYDVRTGRLVYANAGHNDPIAVTHLGARRTLSGGRGAPLGIDPGQVYPGNEAALEPGESLVLYTDGVIEATSPERKLFGAKRFGSYLSAAAGRPLKDLTVRLIGLLDEYQQGARYDDITLMVLRRSRG